MSASLISAKTPDISIPQVRRIVVETRGAQIVQEESPAVSHRNGGVGTMLISDQTRDSRGIYLPHYIEPVSHIAVDVSLSLHISDLPDLTLD